MLAAAVLTGGGCDRPASKPAQAPKPAAKTEWTPEEIAKDPIGYLRWQDKQIERQIGEHEAKIKALDAKKQQFVEKQSMLNANIDEVDNLRVNMERAYKRADDNDRWPATVAGREFERAKLDQLIPQLKKYVQDRQPMQNSYAQFMGRIDSTSAKLHNDIESMRTLREQLALDLQSIELNQATADTTKLQKAQEQVASMSNTLRNMSDDPTNAAVPGEPPGRVKIEELLR
jgi:hypothetical protein